MCVCTCVCVCVTLLVCGYLHTNATVNVGNMSLCKTWTLNSLFALGSMDPWIAWMHLEIVLCMCVFLIYFSCNTSPDIAVSMIIYFFLRLLFTPWIISMVCRHIHCQHAQAQTIRLKLPHVTKSMYTHAFYSYEWLNLEMHCSNSLHSF